VPTLMDASELDADPLPARCQRGNFLILASLTYMTARPASELTVICTDDDSYLKASDSVLSQESQAQLAVDRDGVIWVVGPGAATHGVRICLINRRHHHGDAVVRLCKICVLKPLARACYRRKGVSVS
jgi:hypothetical protein